MSLEFYQSAPFFYECDDDLEKKDPDMCDVAGFNQQVHEDFQSIIHEQTEPMYDSDPFDGSMKEENHLVNSQDDIMLFTWMTPLRPSVDIHYVGTQKDIYGLRVAQKHYRWDY